MSSELNDKLDHARKHKETILFREECSACYWLQLLDLQVSQYGENEVYYQHQFYSIWHTFVLVVRRNKFWSVLKRTKLIFDFLSTGRIPVVLRYFKRATYLQLPMFQLQTMIAELGTVQKVRKYFFGSLANFSAASFGNDCTVE